MYRILSVEDDPEEEAALRSCIQRYAQETGESFDVTWLRSAVELDAERKRYDVVFMDIELPGMNGMDAAGELRRHDQRVPIVFLTNLSQYAIRGYEVDAIAYVLKPVRYGSLALALSKALRIVRATSGGSIAIATRTGTRFVRHDEIVRVEVQNHRLCYVLLDGSTVSTRSTMAQAAQQLASAPFARISNSDLANIALIGTVRADCVEMANGDVIYFSRGRKKEAMAAITAYYGDKA